MNRHRLTDPQQDNSVCAVLVAVLLAATFSVAGECYVEEDDCTVCKKAGANIQCGGGVITCEDELLADDAPFRSVRDAEPNEAGFGKKRPENYGSCRWQPKKVNLLPEGDPCIPDGPPLEKLNVMGEEVYGDSCTGVVER